MCNCYVKELNEIERFEIRRGAHELTCSAYRKSLDSLDHERDQEIRHWNLFDRNKLADDLELKLSLPYYDYDNQVWVE